jgi:uncharacterized protein (DUF983 family)
MNKMRPLTPAEMLNVINATCPICGGGMPVTTDQLEAYLITTKGRCDKCASDFMVDRSYPVPYQLLSGHQYYCD